MELEVIPVGTAETRELVAQAGAERMLEAVRPHWQAKPLLKRVKALLPVDPSSACQRLFNAAVHDLRQKIVLAGLDIAKDAATRNKLPPITSIEDILDNYSASNVLDLSYRVGVLSRPQWRQMRRAYDIRKDLEHEDDEYVATMQDLVYVFATCIDCVLSIDPVEIIRVSEVKDIIEQPARVTVSREFLNDFQSAPEVRQSEIFGMILSYALDASRPDVIRLNAVEALRAFSPIAMTNVKVKLAEEFNSTNRRSALTPAQAKVLAAAGMIAYLPAAKRRDFFDGLANDFEEVPYEWRRWEDHGPLLDVLEDVGGLTACPDSPRKRLVRWMTLCYLGEPGGYGTYGAGRPVFFSDAAAPRIRRLFEANKQLCGPIIAGLGEDKALARAAQDPHVLRRYDSLIDLTEVAGDPRV